jgi:hypothetical protein
MPSRLNSWIDDKMKLRELGFDEWFEAQIGSMPLPGHSLARVTTVDRGGGISSERSTMKSRLNSQGNSDSRFSL